MEFIVIASVRRPDGFRIGTFTIRPEYRRDFEYPRTKGTVGG